MESSELIKALETGYGKSAKYLNAAITKAYSYSKKMFNDSKEEKIKKILPLLEYDHIYVKYWGAVMALSYKVLVEKAMKEVIPIMYLDPKNYEVPWSWRLNILKSDIGTCLHDYLKYGIIGSFPGHNPQAPCSFLPHYGFALWYFRIKYKIPKPRKKKK